MSENDAVNFQDELEKIKLRYRKEALKAVELAEVKGYAKGKSETLKNVEDKLLQWRAIAEATKSNHYGQSKPVLLVKYIVEQIYKHIKKEFPSEAEKLKSTLLTVTESLLSSLPCIVLVKSTSIIDTTTTDTTNTTTNTTAGNTDDHPSSGIKTNDSTITKSMTNSNTAVVVGNTDTKLHPDNLSHDQNHIVEFRTISKYWKSMEQRLFHKSPVAKYFIHIDVKENTHSKTKLGFFGNINTDNLGFQVHTEIAVVNQKQSTIDAIRSGQHRMNNSFTSDKRMNDIKTLYQKLTKEFPKLVLPSYYSNTNQRQPLLHHSSSNTEDKINAIIRQIKMWLQYLANIECIQNSPNMLTFLIGTPKLVIDNDAVVSNQSNKHRIHRPFNELYIYAVHNQPLFSSYNYKISKKTSLIAYEDLQKVKSELLNLETSSVSVIEKTVTLINAQTIFLQNTKHVASSLNELRCFIISGGSDDVNIGAAIQTSSQPLENITEVWTIEFYEHMDFFESKCSNAMKDSVSKTLKTYPQQLFISPPLVTTNAQRKQSVELSSEGRVDSSSEPPVTKLIPLSVLDGVDTAMMISQSWDRSNHIKSATMLHQILQMAHSFTDKYHKAKLNWIEALKLLEAMNVISTSADQLTASLTLKDCILNETQELDSNLARLRKSFEKGYCIDLQQTTLPTQDNVTTTTSALSSSWSFGAIFSRPKLPHGIRRQPKVPSFCEVPYEVPRDIMSNIHADQLLDSAKIAEEETYLLNLAEAYNLSNSVSETHNEAQQGGGINSGTMDDPLMDRVKRHQLLRRHLHQPATNTKMKASIGSIVAVTQAHLSEDVGVSALKPAVPQTNITTSTSYNKKANYASYFPDSRTNHNNSDYITNKPTTNTMKSKDEIKATSDKNIPASTSFIASNNKSNIDQNHEMQNNKTEIISPPANEPFLPVGWEKVTCENGSIYYYHQVTRVSRWDCPTAEVAAALEARLHKSEEAAQKRVIEKEKEKKIKVDMETKINLALSKVKKTIELWSHPPGARMSKNIGELLSTLHVILEHISTESILGSSSANLLNINSDPIMIKKAYLRAVRFLHPDKLPDDMELETKLIAEAAFITITDTYNKYRERIDLNPKS